MARRGFLVGVLFLVALGACVSDDEPEARSGPVETPSPSGFAFAGADCPETTNELSFISARGNAEHVYVLDIRRPREVERVTHLSGLAQTPTWSPNGRRLAFQRLEPGANSPGIYITDAKGTKPRLLVTGAAAPAWSPDGHTLAVANLRAEQRGISLVDVDTLDERGRSRLTILTKTSGLVPEEWPQFTPDGTHVLFTSQRDGSSDVWITDLSGNLRNLTPGSSLDTTPSMSPDGRWIAFGSNRDAVEEGGGDIYVMRADGSDVTRITDSEDNYDPAWSPDGRFIAFTSQEPGHSAIYSMRPDGSERRRLTTSPHPEAMPAWVGNCRVGR